MRQQDALAGLREGLPVLSRFGLPVGTITRVHREATQPGAPPVEGYIEVDGTLPDRVVHYHIPLTEVLEVRADGAVVELDRDIVAAHNQQIKPEKAPD